MIWANFGENRTNRLGRVRQSRFYEQLKIAKKLNLTIFEFWTWFNSDWAKDSEEKIILILWLTVQTLLAFKNWIFGQVVALENLMWDHLLFTVSSISVPNFTTFPQSVLWAAIHFRRKKQKKKIITPTITIGAYAPSVLAPNNNANKHNRCLRTFGAWPLIITQQ